MMQQGPCVGGPLLRLCRPEGGDLAANQHDEVEVQTRTTCVRPWTADTGWDLVTYSMNKKIIFRQNVGTKMALLPAFLLCRPHNIPTIKKAILRTAPSLPGKSSKASAPGWQRLSPLFSRAHSSTRTQDLWTVAPVLLDAWALQASCSCLFPPPGLHLQHHFVSAVSRTSSSPDAKPQQVRRSSKPNISTKHVSECPGAHASNEQCMRGAAGYHAHARLDTGASDQY
jgi:hypothetical protein